MLQEIADETGDERAAAEAERLRTEHEAHPDPGHRLYWDAFLDLTHDRAERFVVLPGGGASHLPGRIPYTAIAAWAEAHGLDMDERGRLKLLLRAMDTEYLAIAADERHKQGGHGPETTGSPSQG